MDCVGLPTWVQACVDLHERFGAPVPEEHMVIISRLQPFVLERGLLRPKRTQLCERSDPYGLTSCYPPSFG